MKLNVGLKTLICFFSLTGPVVMAAPQLQMKNQVKSKERLCLMDILNIDNSNNNEDLRSKLSRFCSVPVVPGKIERKSVEIFLLQAGVYPFVLDGEHVSVIAHEKRESGSAEMAPEQWPPLRVGQSINLTLESECCRIGAVGRIVRIKENTIIVRRGRRQLTARRTAMNEAEIIPELN